MKRSIIYFLILAVPLVSLSAAPSPVSGSDKVTIYGCDGSEWEGSSGVAKGPDELQGTWVGKEMNHAGQWTVTFTNSGTFEVKGPENEWYSGEYACDSNQDPRQLNFYTKQSGNPARIEQTSFVIYKIETNTLTCAISDPGAKNRPGSFASESGAKVIVFTKQQ